MHLFDTQSRTIMPSSAVNLYTYHLFGVALFHSCYVCFTMGAIMCHNPLVDEKTFSRPCEKLTRALQTPLKIKSTLVYTNKENLAGKNKFKSHMPLRIIK